MKTFSGRREALPATFSRIAGKPRQSKKFRIKITSPNPSETGAFCSSGAHSTPPAHTVAIRCSATPRLVGGFIARKHCRQSHRVIGFHLVVQCAECCLMAIVSLYKLHILEEQKLIDNMAINIMCIFGGWQVFFTNCRWA